MEIATPPGSIDRTSPTLQPAQSPVMFQEWRHLSFLHCKEISPSSPRDLVPPDLEIDTLSMRRTRFVGLVPFTMRCVRPRYLPSLPCLSYFHETNVRTYVHRAGRDPGVWFFSLEAANPVAVALARATFVPRLPYFHAKMSLEPTLPAILVNGSSTAQTGTANGRPQRAQRGANSGGRIGPPRYSGFARTLFGRTIFPFTFNTRGENFFAGKFTALRTPFNPQSLITWMKRCYRLRTFFAQTLCRLHTLPRA